jgi:tetratricopeptide (TPR) repeat protein
MVKEIVILKKYPDTIGRMYNLAVSYDRAGRRDEALKLREQVLALRRAKLGPDHPDTLRSIADLANSYAVAGRRDEAQRLGEELLVLRKAKLGPGHADTLRTMAALASSYARAGQLDRALKLREETLALLKAKLGPAHLETLLSMHNLAISYAAAGQNERALAISEEMLASQKAKLGPDHPVMLTARLSIASSKVKLGRAADAADCRHAAEAFEKLNRTDANSLYNAACFRAVLAAAMRGGAPSAESTKQANDEADRAMSWLKKSIAAGFKDAANMSHDHDLDALRDRADFKRLLSDLQGAAGAKK